MVSELVLMCVFVNVMLFDGEELVVMVDSIWCIVVVILVGVLVLMNLLWVLIVVCYSLLMMWLLFEFIGLLLLF